MRRHPRSILPTMSNPLRPRVVHPDLARGKWRKKRDTQGHYYNRGAGELKPLARGEEVHIQTKSGSWMPAAVLGQYGTPRSYTAVCSSDGRKCRTNRCHLLTTRSLSAKGNPWGQGHKPEMSTATWESIEETESKPMFNPFPSKGFPIDE